jgi:PAS domain S-box-containing protein
MESPIRILYIDDSSLDRALVRDVLEKDHPGEFQLTEAATRQEFEARLGETDYDLILSDFNILGFEGLLVIDAVHAKDPSVPVVIVTGTGSEEVAVEAMKRRAADYVIKTPSHIQKLPRTIRAVLEKRRIEMERDRAVEALRRSEAKYRELVQNANSIILRTDSQGNILFFNEFAQSFFGYTEQEVLGRNVVGTIVPETDAAGRDMTVMIRDIRRHPERYTSHEHENMCRNGDRVWVAWANKAIRDNQGDVVEILSIGNDITRRKGAEEESARLMTAIEQAAETIVITDPEGMIQYVNPAFEKTSGYSREEAVGLRPGILRSGKHDEVFYEELWNVLRRGGVWSGHFINRKKDGTLYEEEATISPVRDASGRIVNYVAVKRDVTQEAALRSRLRQAQKMEALGTLAGGISHDFNNILSVIFGYAEMASLDAAAGGASLQPHLDQILEAARRARDLVQQILAFSRQTEQDRKPLHAALVVKETLKLLRATLPSTIEIRHQVNVDSNGDIVLSDPTQMHQILMNLCTNAAHAMRGKGGVLEVHLSELRVDTTASFRYPDLMPGPYLMLTVGDTGHGMEREILERIFDPYFTTKGPGEGTGLGLAVIHGIVKSHGGAISVESEPGKGSLFHVLLPRVVGAPREEAGQPLTVKGGTERVLLVDDEIVLAQLGKGMLERLGYRVVSKSSSIEALEAFRTQPGQFDLVITDQTMPHMTGVALAREILRIRPSIPVILCTGHADSAVIEAARATGVREFLAKPVTLRQLAETVRCVLDQ